MIFLLIIFNTRKRYC